MSIIVNRFENSDYFLTVNKTGAARKLLSYHAKYVTRGRQMVIIKSKLLPLYITATTAP